MSIKNEKQRDFVIGVIYRPPTGNIRNFCENIKKTVTEILSKGNIDIFLIGDFNIDYSYNRALGRNDLRDMEMSTGLKQLVKEPTRYGTWNTLIDLLFTKSDFVFESGVLDINLSDHEGIYLIRKKRREYHKRVDKYGRSYLRYNKEVFKEKIKNQDWSTIYLESDVNIIWNHMEMVIRKEMQCVLLKE